jgi:hypothetical protein
LRYRKLTFAPVTKIPAPIASIASRRHAIQGCTRPAKRLRVDGSEAMIGSPAERHMHIKAEHA